MSEQQQIETGEVEQKPTDSFEGFISAAGTILAISYPVLALSTGYRAVYRLFFKDGDVNVFGSSMTLVAASCYLIATIGIVMRERWGTKAWWLSVGVLGFETTMTLLIGTLSFIIPEQIGSTAWRHFGADYGFFPLIQPILGLAWLFNKRTMAAYGFER